MKKILITGASRGIGKATKERFETNNYEVIAPTRNELDLTSNDSIHNFCKKYNDTTFYSIINNAGINNINCFGNLEEKDIDLMIQTNLKAPILLLNELVINMKKVNEGRIVNIASIWAVVSKEGRGVYSATKNGIHGITNSLALELAKYGILVNTVCPGFTLTELTSKNNTQKEIDLISDNIPMNRLAQPEEIANLIYFLGSESNTYITGQKITIDGGYTIQWKYNQNLKHIR